MFLIFSSIWASNMFLTEDEPQKAMEMLIDSQKIVKETKNKKKRRI